MRKTLFLLFALVLAGCVSSEKHALHEARTNGYPRAFIYSFEPYFPTIYGCSQQDRAGFLIRADRPNGDRRLLTVCCGPQRAHYCEVIADQPAPPPLPH